MKTFVCECEARTLEPDERESSKGVDVKENERDKSDVNAKRYLLNAITKKKIELIEHVMRHNVKSMS